MMTKMENIKRQLAESAETKQAIIEFCLIDIEAAADLMIGTVQKK